MIFVTALLIYVMVRFNRKANPTPARFTHNSPLEVVMDADPDRDPCVHQVFCCRSCSSSRKFRWATSPSRRRATRGGTGTDEYVDEGINFDSYMIGSPATGGANMMTSPRSRFLS